MLLHRRMAHKTNKLARILIKSHKQKTNVIPVKTARFPRLANLETAKNLGMTPMHIAASKGFVEIMRCLSEGEHATVSVNVASKVGTHDACYIPGTVERTHIL